MPTTEKKKTTVRRLFFQREQEFAQEWDSVQPENERTLIPPGQYEGTLVDGEAFEARTGTPGYRLIFAIANGEFQNKRVSMRLWLTIDAAPRTKAVLSKVGLGPLFRDLDGDVPKGLRVTLYVTSAESRSGRLYNEVEEFELADSEDARLLRRGPLASKREPSTRRRDATVSARVPVEPIDVDDDYDGQVDEEIGLPPEPPKRKPPR